jgi:cell division protein FtsQ
MSEKRPVSRSDEVRQRRTREQAKRQQQASERAYRPQSHVKQPSRTLRLVSARPRTDRRYNIAVGLPQPSLHFPTMPRIKPGWRMVSLGLIVLLGVALYLLWNLPYFRVTEAQVTGAARLSPQEINAAMGVSGQPIFTVRPEEIATRLRLAYPELSSAVVTVGWPNQVQVQVVERQPVLLWQQDNGYTWIDASGVAFRPRGDVSGLVPVMSSVTPPPGAPSLTDPFSPTPYLSPDMVKAAQTLSTSLPAGVTMIYDPKNGFGWNDPQGWQVYFGSASKDMALKVRVYQSLVASLSARGVIPAFISVVHVDAPYYRMAQ